MAGDLKYCPNCGTPHSLEVIFCSVCGTKFPDSASPASTPISQPQAGNANFITLSCPNCGGKLQITPDIERFACQYCGYEHIVRRSGGVVSLEPVMQMMGQINQGIDVVGQGVQRLITSAERQAAESAINRCKEEITAAKQKIESDLKNKKSIWTLTLYMALGAGSMFIIRSISYGVDDSLDLMLTIFFWMMIGLTLLMPVAGISSSIYYKKDITRQNALIRQKEVEMKRNYQILS